MLPESPPLLPHSCPWLGLLSCFYWCPIANVLPSSIKVQCLLSHLESSLLITDNQENQKNTVNGGKHTQHSHLPLKETTDIACAHLLEVELLHSCKLLRYNPIVIQGSTYKGFPLYVGGSLSQLETPSVSPSMDPFILLSRCPQESPPSWITCSNNLVLKDPAPQRPSAPSFPGSWIP